MRNRIPAWEGLRSEQYKYARYFDHQHEFLYDLKSDPEELVNLAGDPGHASTLQAMRARTQAVVDQLGGPLAPMKGEFQTSTVPHPAASAAVTDKPGADGFANLFNGKNLNGWAGDSEFWSVEERALTGKTDGTLKMNHFITWKGSTIRNFELQMKVKISAGGNSGLQ